MTSKKVLIKEIGISLLTVVFIFSLFSCGETLNKDLKKQAESIPDTIDNAASRVKDNQKKFNSLKQSKEFEPFKAFAQKENWDGSFQKAAQTLDRAEKLYKSNLAPLVKKNKPEVAAAVKKEIKRIQEVIKEAEQVSEKPAQRYARIQNTISNAEQLDKQARKNADQISQVVDMIQTGVAAKALTDFPDMAEKINARTMPAVQLSRESAGHLKTVTEQYAVHQSGGNADYAAFTDAVLALDQGKKQVKALETTISDDMGQLYTSYTKILKDMKEDYFVTVKRESWDENADIYKPQFATFTRQVSPETYDILTADNLDTIGAITAGFSGSRFSSQVGGAWDELKLNPTDNWPSRSHNAASFWVEGTREAYFHKYILEKDGQTEETDWKKVDASVYNAELEYLGMALLAKPYGTFEQDRLTQAAPPGMAYVGNDQYGEWKKDNDGNQFWSWYGKYMFFSNLFFFPPSYYRYNSWNGWRNNYRYKKPYFGKTKKGFKKYGTYGTYVKKSPKFQSTRFAKSGGFKSQAASVRGAGANLRGGGPKSKGK